MTPKKRYFESVKLGDEMPAVAKAPVDRAQLIRYAAAINDFSPVCVDEAFAKANNLPSISAAPGFAMGLLGQIVCDWGFGGQLVRFSSRFFRMVWPQDTLVCRGRVFDREGKDGRYLVDLDVWAENQRGELVIRGLATVRLFYSADDEHRARSGQPRIVVNVARHSIAVAPPASAPPPKRAPANSARPSQKSRAPTRAPAPAKRAKSLPKMLKKQKKRR